MEAQVKLKSSTFVVVSILSILFNLVACGGSNNKADGSSSTGTTSPGAPTSVVISSDHPLEIFTLDLLSAITPSGSPVATSGSGSTPSAGGISFTAGGSTITASGNVSALAGATASGTGDVAISGYSAFTANISITASFPSGADQGCSVLGTFSSINCLLAGFTISNTDISSSTTLSVRAQSTNGDANAYLDSNSLTVKKNKVEKISAVENGGFSSTLISSNIIEFGGSIYYVANNSSNVAKIFKLTGTTLQEFSNTKGNQTLSDSPTIVGEFNSELYFNALNSSGVYKLFKTDGTTITQVSNIIGNQASADTVARFTVYNGKAYFAASMSSTVRKLYSLNTNGVITQVSNTSGSNAVSDVPNYMMVWQNKLYFSAATAAGIFKLFSYDGTTMTQVSNINGNSTNDAIASPYLATNYIYFWANNQNGVIKLFKTDGTTVTQVSNTHNNESLSDVLSATPANLPGQVEYNGKFYFWGLNQNNSYKLYCTDGTTVTQVSNTINNNASADNVILSITYPKTVYVFNGMLYFASAQAAGISKLYKTDGTTITQVSNLAGASVTDYIELRAVYNNDLYFTGLDSNGNQKLFKTDGTSITKVMDINSASEDFDTYQWMCSGNSPFFATLSSGLYFSAYSDYAGCKETIFRIRSL